MQPSVYASSLSELAAQCPPPHPLWVVDLPRQRLLRLDADGRLLALPISSSRSGLGNQPNSGCTPLGWHRVVARIGTGLPAAQAFRSRRPVSPDEAGSDPILGRILWLKGCVPGLNRHTQARYIYLHGTPEVDRLGTPASCGCIRVAGEALAAWSDALTGPLPCVWIGSLPRP